MSTVKNTCYFSFFMFTLNILSSVLVTKPKVSMYPEGKTITLKDNE